MADKLPILYVRCDGNGKPALAPDGSILAQTDPNAFAPVGYCVVYEPALLRCPTCNAFVADGPTFHDGATKLCSRGQPLGTRFVPSDGSGYCWEHSELMP